MPKKTSRSARALQAQRTSLTGERKTAARPLIDVGSSRLAAEAQDQDTEELGQLDAVFEPKTAPVPAMTSSNTLTTATRQATGTTGTRPSSPASSSNVMRPASASRRPMARRTATAVNRAPAISREEEYAFIRSDLLTVALLTILMIIALVVLTIVIGR